MTDLLRLLRKKIKFHAQRLKRMPCFNHLEHEDLEQELFISVWSSWKNFDAEKSKASTFMEHILLKRSTNLIQHQMCLKRGRDVVGSVSLNADYEEGLSLLDFLPDPKNEELHTHIRLDLTKILAALPDNLRTLCEDLKNHTISELSQEKKRARSSIYKDISRIQTWFKHFSEGERADQPHSES